MPRAGLVVSLSPALVLAIVAAADLALGPTRNLSGLLAIVPLLAATIVGCRLTMLYAVVALLAGVVLGWMDGAYTPDMWPAQAVRLAGVAVGGVMAVVACTARSRREARLRELTVEAARAHAHARETEVMAGLAETLQRSLLTEPPQLDHLQIRARYVPASEHVKIGGDWYDAFAAPGGRTMLVIGDIAGHGQPAAAAMAQVRHTLRGITQILQRSPAAVLDALDAALDNLDARVLASVVLAQVTHDLEAGRPRLLVTWANAGHPPPILVPADGDARLLERTPEPLLGLGAEVHRSDHQVRMAAGDSLLMFTDGLVEQRGHVIDDGLEWVRATASGTAGRPLDEMCDAVMQHPHTAGDDDIALIAVRAELR